VAAVSKRTRSIVVAVVVVLAIAGWNAFVRDDGGAGDAATSSTVASSVERTTAAPSGVAEPTTATTRRPASSTTTTSVAAAAEAVSDLPVASTADLPPEALDTLALIEAGGPYPYDQDDGVFGNREGILPDAYDGYYREYTVVPPGEGDRGARRFVVGADGEVFYTDDHYESFVEVVDAHL
jgi:ribonuclease T1